MKLWIGLKCLETRKNHRQKKLLRKSKTIASKQKNTKSRYRNQNLNSKQTINHTYNIISTNKSWKHFMQTKKRNQTSSVSTLSAQ